MLEKLKCILSRKVKLTLDKILICPLFDYADVVYNCLTQYDSNVLQKLKNSALRLILNRDKTTSTVAMHNELNFDFPSDRCLQHCQTQVYKYLNGLAPQRLTKMMTIYEHEHSMTT